MMAGYDKEVGYILIATGIVILLFTLYEANNLFVGYNNGTLIPAQNSTIKTTVPIITSNSISQPVLMSLIVQNLAADVISSLPINVYFGYTLAVLLLSVFASVGYKIAKIGVDMISLDKAKKEDNDKAKETENS